MPLDPQAEALLRQFADMGFPGFAALGEVAAELGAALGEPATA